MALFHLATITPTKAELIARMGSDPTVGARADGPMEVIGSYRFDDPDGRVGMETHLVTAGGTLLQVPLTYRDEPLDGADDALIVEMQHSVLGTRWVYDGLRDPRFVVMLAAVAMTGQGEAVGMAVLRRPLVHRAEQRPHPGRGLDTGARARRRLRHRSSTTRRAPCSATTGSSSSCTGGLRPGRARRSGSPRRGTAGRTTSCSPR